MLLFVAYFIFISFIFFSFLLCLVTFLFSLNNSYFNKKSSYECGFSSVGSIQASFSVHFYNLMLIFVIFDLEVVFLLGFIGSSSILMFIIFLFLIYVSYYLEVNFSSFNWMS